MAKEVARRNTILFYTLKVFLSIVPVILSRPDGEMDTYAFLDSGSTVTLIATHVAMQLGLKCEVDPLQSQLMNKATLDEASSEQVDVWIKGTGERYKLEDIRTYTELKLPQQNLDVKTAGWEYLKDLDIPKMSGAVLRILIGEDYAHLKVQLKAVMGKRNEPFAVLTPVGWTIRG